MKKIKPQKDKPQLAQEQETMSLPAFNSLLKKVAKTPHKSNESLKKKKAVG